VPEEDLGKQIADMHKDVALRKKGSVKKAQALAKKLRLNGRNKEADLLIRKSNEAARFMPRENW
jgi:hypothetical protein